MRASADLHFTPRVRSVHSRSTGRFAGYHHHGRDTRFVETPSSDSSARPDGTAGYLKQMQERGQLVQDPQRQLPPVLDRERVRRRGAALPDAETLLSKTSKEVVAEMRALKVAATQFRSLEELKKVYTVATVNAKLTYQFVELCDHPVGRLIMVPPLAVRWNFQVQALGESPKYGSDTARLLSTCNRSASSSPAQRRRRTAATTFLSR